MASTAPRRTLHLPRQLPWGRGLAWSAASGAAAALLAQAVPPLHVPAHEFTQLFVVLACVVQLHLSAMVWNWISEREGREVQALCVALVAAIVMGGAAYLVQTTANALVHHCDPTGTAVFFWVTWLPLGAWMSVLGVACADCGFGWIKRSLVLLALALLSLLNDAAQIFAGVRFADPWIGELLIADQRADMVLPEVHLLGRIWLAGLAITFWVCWRAWRRRDTTSVLKAVLVALVFVFVSVAAGSHLGLGPGRGVLKSELDGEYRSTHVRFLYDSRGSARLRLEEIAREAEYAHDRLSAAWGRPLGDLEIRLYENRRQIHRVTGVRNSHAGLRHVDLLWWHGLTTTMPHELVHALHVDLTWNPGLLLSRGQMEGSAEAFSEGYAEIPEAHHELAAALRADKLPAAQDFMSPAGFWKVDEGNAYDAAGSFVGFLVLRYGVDRWIELQRHLDYEGVYGLDLDGLDAEWRSFLEQVPVELEDQAAARERFDPENAPGLFEDTCPKLGPLELDPGRDATARLDAGDHRGALDIYRTLYEADSNPKWAWGMVSALQRLGLHDDALQVLEETLGQPEAPDQQLRWLKVRLNSLLHMGRWEAIDAALGRRAELEQAGEPPLVQALLRDPTLREELARVLLRKTGRGQRSVVGHRLRQLADDHPEHAEALHRLMLTHGFDLPKWRHSEGDPELEARNVGEALGFIEQSPRACDGLAERLHDSTLRLLDIGACELAERVVSTITAHCDKRPNIARAEILSGRLRWEHEVHGKLNGACAQPQE